MLPDDYTAPDIKVTFATLGVATAQVFLWVLEMAASVEVDRAPEMALSIIFAFLFGYMKRSPSLSGDT